MSISEIAIVTYLTEPIFNIYYFSINRFIISHSIIILFLFISFIVIPNFYEWVISKYENNAAGNQTANIKEIIGNWFEFFEWMIIIGIIYIIAVSKHNIFLMLVFIISFFLISLDLLLMFSKCYIPFFKNLSNLAEKPSKFYMKFFAAWILGLIAAPFFYIIILLIILIFYLSIEMARI